MQEADLPLLTRAARSAADIALRYWKTELHVESKDGGSPVSEADYAVDAHLREILTSARPEYGWLSEETEDSDSRLCRDTIFVVDPIDGTRSYVAGQSTWAISIAVVRHGKPVAGVVHLPVPGKSYTAEKGKGSLLNGMPLAIVGRDTADGAAVLGPASSLDPQSWAKPPPLLDRHWRPSLAYRFCLVAEGRFDAVLTLKDVWEWDIAAGLLIAQEAGATVTDRNDRPPLLNSTDAKIDGVFAAAPFLHRTLISRYLDVSEEEQESLPL